MNSKYYRFWLNAGLSLCFVLLGRANFDSSVVDLFWGAIELL